MRRGSHRTGPSSKLGVILAVTGLIFGLAGGPSVGAQEDDEGPAPIGSPATRQIARSDDLWISNSAGSSIDVGYMEMKPDLSAPSSQPDQVQVAGRLASTTSGRKFPQVRGRFNDPWRDKVLVARRTGSGCVVDSPNYYIEPDWQSKGEPGGRITAYTRLGPCSGPMALAAGDLDRQIDAKKQYRDEAVLVSDGPNHTVQVDVLDFLNFSSDWSEGVTTSRDVIHSGLQSVGVAIADVDGDSRNEIAVFFIPDDSSEIRYHLLRYEGPGKLSFIGDTGGDGKVVPSKFKVVAASYLDTTTGNFDTDTSEEIALVAFERDESNKPMASFVVLGFDASGAIDEFGWGGQPTWTSGLSTKQQWEDARPVLRSGLFHFDPANGFGISRSQLLFAFATPQNGVEVIVVNVLPHSAFDCAASMKCSLELTTFAASDITSDDTSPPYVSVATGNFKGISQNAPTWSTAVAVMPTSGKPSTITFYDLELTPGGRFAAALNKRFEATDVGTPNLIAYDRQGKSLIVGPPLRMTAENVIRTDMVIQEPPKHVDWMPADRKFFNISRNPDYTVTTVDSKGVELASSTTETSDWSIGGSVTASVETEVSAGEGLAKEKGSLGVTGSVGYKYDEESKDFNKNQSSYENKISGTTTDDDYISGSFQDLAIWRYPILAPLADTNGEPITQDGKPMYGFWDVQVPPTNAPVPFSGDGRFFSDWYQPDHENGNVLSYPHTVNGLVPTPDLGSYQLPGDSKAKEQTLLNYRYDVARNRFSDEISFSDSNAQGSDRTTNNTLSESVDVDMSYQFKAGFEIGDVGATEKNKVSVDLSFDNENSWGDMSTSEKTSTSGRGFMLDLDQPAASDWAYSAATAYYYAKDGTEKVTHAVDVNASSAASKEWVTHYGTRPDPALNLPYRIVMVRNPSYGNLEEPKFSASLAHQLIRGFFVMHRDGSDRPFAGDPVEGDPLEFRVRVHNYSLAKPVSNLTVRFQAIPLSDDDEPGTPIVIGEKTGVNIDPLGVADVDMPWDTTGKGGVSSQAYRIFVTLDPAETGNGNITEVHELNDRYDFAVPEDETEFGEALDDPMTGKPEVLEAGQNNRGYGEVTIHAKTVAGTAAVRPTLAAVSGAKATTADVTTDLRVEDMAARIPGRELQSDDAVAQVDRSLDIRVDVNSDDRRLAHERLLLFDGDPAKGGKLVAAKRTQGLDGKGASHVWLTWVPDKVGKHTLYAKLLDTDDKRGGNETQALDVVVTRDGKPLPSKGPSPLLIVAIAVVVLAGGIVGVRAIRGKGRTRTAATEPESREPASRR